MNVTTKGLFIVGWIVVFAAGCAGLKLQRMPEPDSEALALYKEKCSQCHGLPHPKRHSKNEWDGMLTLMNTQMEARNVPINREEMRIIRDYLHRNAR